MAELYGDVGEAFQVEYGAAADLDAVAGEFNEEISAAVRDLLGGHCGFVEPGGPVGSERAVGGAGDGVFVDALGGGEEAGDEVTVLAGGGGNDGEVGQGGEGLHVGPKGGNVSFCRENAQKVAGLIDGLRRAVERGS